MCLLSVVGRIACKDASLFDAFSCLWTLPSTFYLDNVTLNGWSGEPS
jgi:hypothetical protein